MSRPYLRRPLPSVDGPAFITDGGLETTLIFHDGIDLPGFNSCVLLRDVDGQQHLRDYFRRYAEIARRHRTGLILETATWRAQSHWLAEIGIDPAEFENINRTAIHFANKLRSEFEADLPGILVAGCVGPRGDGYVPDQQLTAAEAEAHHRPQIALFARHQIDFVSAMTITTIEEALGITRAAQAEGIPVTISFTVETDGRLPTGHTLQEAIETIDAATAEGPAYYMINCAHPTHFEAELRQAGPWRDRIRAIRANASRCSHAELNEATTLDEGDPADFGQRYAALQAELPQLTVFGGCCGTDHRHVDALCAAVTRQRRRPTVVEV